MSLPDERESRLPIRVIAVALVAGLALAVMIWGLRLQRSRDLATLPDGTTVELLGTARGTERFSTETKLHRLTKRYLPGAVQQLLPEVATGGSYFSSNSITVYLRAPRTAARTGSWPPWRGVAAEDETGFRYPRDGSYGSSTQPSGDVVMGLPLRAYPRRQQEFLFHLVDQKGTPMASWRVANPVPGPFPKWEAQPLPQTRSNGPVTLTLLGWKEFQGVRTYPWPSWRLEAKEPAWAQARARFQGFADATGNEGQFLSPRESAWKARALVYRERPQDFAINEQIVLTNLALPGVGSFLSLDRSADCAGVTIKALVLAGPGKFGISNGVTRFMLPPSGAGQSGHSTESGSFGRVDTWSSSSFFVLLETRNMQGDDELKMEIIDEARREIKVTRNGYEGQVDGGRIYKFEFRPHDDAKAIVAQIFFNRPLAFEFMVNPQEVRPAPPWK